MTQARADAGFKRRLLAEPAAVLKEKLGQEVPEGAQVRVVENTDWVVHRTLPAKPQGELSEADLERVAWGAGRSAAQLFGGPLAPPL